MKKITLSELLALFSKTAGFIEKRLGRDDVDGIIVFERVEEPGKGKKTACVFGSPYTLKSWRDAQGVRLGENTNTQMDAVAYYEKRHESDELQV